MNVKETHLKYNPYPGRGIVIGMTPDGKNLVQIYWIMGRSVNSRNRVFIIEDDSVRTKAFDESKFTDPSLVIYYPLRVIGNSHIITNGDQTDTIYDYIKAGKSFAEALLTREFEPDAPNFTPRISGIINYNGAASTYSLSILKTVNNNKDINKREFYDYSSFTAGTGKCIHTYSNDGNPLPSFDENPYDMSVFNTIKENLSFYWDILNSDNKVSLLVKFIDIETGKSTIEVINSNK